MGALQELCVYKKFYEKYIKHYRIGYGAFSTVYKVLNSYNQEDLYAY